MRFYGQPYEYFNQKDIQSIDLFTESMNRQVAADNLRAYTVASYPNLKDNARDRIHRNMYKIAYPESVKAKAVTAENLTGIPQITPEMVKQWKAKRNGKRNKSTARNRHNSGRQKTKDV